MARLFPDARLVELRSALAAVIDASYTDEATVETLAQIAIDALAVDDELRERMEREGTAPLPPGGRRQ